VKNRGIFSISLGAVSAQQTLDYIHLQTGEQVGASSWIGGGQKIRPEKVGEFYTWMKRVANDMLSTAKDHGRNQAFVPQGNIAALIRKPITADNIAQTHEAAIHPEIVGLDTLTGLMDSYFFNAETRTFPFSNRALFSVLQYKDDPDAPKTRAFHDIQGNDYAYGNRILRELGNLVATAFDPDKSGDRLIARFPPDTFAIASDPEIVGSLPDIDALYYSLRQRIPELDPRFVVYQVSHAELQRVSANIRHYFRQPMQAVDAIDMTYFFLEALNRVGPERIKSEALAHVEQKDYHTIIRFDASKAEKLLQSYLATQDERAENAAEVIRKQIEAEDATRGLVVTGNSNDYFSMISRLLKVAIGVGGSLLGQDAALAQRTEHPALFAVNIILTISLWMAFINSEKTIALLHRLILQPLGRRIQTSTHLLWASS